MKTIIASISILLVSTVAAQAASYTMRYYDGKNIGQITPLKDERACHKMAKQKRLNRNDYYCIQTGKNWDYNLERELGWR